MLKISFETYCMTERVAGSVAATTLGRPGEGRPRVAYPKIHHVVCERPLINALRKFIPI